MSEDDTPPTSKTRRRLTIALILLLLAVVFTHATWSLLVQRRLDGRLRQLHDAGEPIYPADFITPKPPAGQNAADDLLAITDILKQPDAVPKAFDRMELGLPLTPDEIRTITDTLAARQDVLTLADAAARKTQVHWDLDPNTPTVFTLLPGLSGSRGAANLLRADALLAHQQGRDDHAVERIEQILSLSRHVDQQPILIAHLVAAGLAALATQTAEDIAPDLRIGTAPGHVPPARLRALIDQLLDDQPLRAGMTHALRGERKDGWLIVDQICSGQMSLNAVSGPAAAPGGAPGPNPAMSLKLYAIRPVFQNDADTLTRVYTTVIEGFKAAPDLPAFAAAVNINRQFPEIEARPALHIFSTMMTPSAERVMTTHFRIVTDLRLTATALALRAYAADHAGHLPPTLDALVPTYLPTVPADAMATAGAKLHYRPATTQPILYSVGTDATDNAGDESPAPNVRRFDARPLDRWQTRDAVLHLTRQPRYTPPPEEDPQP